MPVRTIYSKAVRLNGFSDGMVVPTGAFRESGVDMFAADHSEKTGATNKVSSYESDDPKMGRKHFPMEGNALNNMVGAFTIEAFVVPDHGGVVVHKPDCFTLKVGTPFAPGPAVFEVTTRDAAGNITGERLSTSRDFPQTTETWGTYADGSSKPHDLALPSRELLYLNAQFTASRMLLYINGDLVGKHDFNGDDRLIRTASSDLFLGGQGGEYRGVIESVRISRGVIEPQMQPFTATAETIGLWDFDDEDDIPDLYFFNNRNPAHPQQGKDGVGKVEDGLMPIPMVCIGYDFRNVEVGALGITNPLTLTEGYNYGTFKIRDFPAGVAGTERPTALELLASTILSIPVNELRFQSWWDSGHLDISSVVTKATYHSDGIPVTNLNAVVNASGTNPVTGGSVSPFTYYRETSTAPYSPEGGINLDPMVNPIERVRIVAIDFTNDNVAIQSTLLRSDTDAPKTQGFLFGHPDNTPVWFTLGNADLVVDPGKAEARPRGQMSRARFSQNQRFTDRTGLGNDAYWISTKSRMTEAMQDKATAVGGMSYAYEPPHGDDLLVWLDASDKTVLLRDDGSAVVTNDEFVFWWKNKARIGPNTDSGEIGETVAQNDFHFYSWGNGWRWKQNCGRANNRAGLVAAGPTEAILHPSGGYSWPGGTPTIKSGVVIPNYPSGVTYYDGSSWVNGVGKAASEENRVNYPTGLNIEPIHTGMAPIKSGLALWLRADSLAATLNDGDSVSQWSDESGNNRHVLQGTASSQPTYRASPTGYNNRPAVQFDGGDSLAMAAFDAGMNTNEFTSFVVTSPSVDNATYEGIVSAREGTGTPVRQGFNLYADMTGSGNRYEFWFGRDTSYGITQAAGGSAVLNQATMVRFGVSGGDGAGATATTSISVDGATAVTGSHGYYKQTSADGEPYSVGIVPSIYMLDGHIAEVLHYDRALTAAEIEVVERYLTAKYGITHGAGLSAYPQSIYTLWDDGSNEGPATTDGDWSFYVALTPAYEDHDVLGLIHSEGNDGLQIRADGSGVLTGTTAITGQAAANGTVRPDAGEPSLIAVRIDESAAQAYWLTRSNRGSSSSTATAAWASTNPLVFDNIVAQTGGMELFGEMTDAGSGQNALTNMAQNGLIVHEVLIYPKFLSDAEHADVVQWFEDRFGV